MSDPDEDRAHFVDFAGMEDNWLEMTDQCLEAYDEKEIENLQYLLVNNQRLSTGLGRPYLSQQHEEPPTPVSAQAPEPQQAAATAPTEIAPIVSQLASPTQMPAAVQQHNTSIMSPVPSAHQPLQAHVATSDTTTTNSIQMSPAPALAKPNKLRKGKKDKHKCPTAGCSQVFDSKTALSIHCGRIHKLDTKEKSYECQTCGKRFHNSSYLSQHMKIHSGDKPYECSKPGCNKRFIQLSHKQQHERTHTGEKPYACKHPGCEKSFSQLSNLQSHTRSHLPEGLVKCSSCYKCFQSEAALERHNQQAHMAPNRARVHQCTLCPKKYTQDTYLRSHMVKKHGLEAANKSLCTDQDTSVQAATDMCADIKDPRTDEQTSGMLEKIPAQSMALNQGFGFDYMRAAVNASQSFQTPNMPQQFTSPAPAARREFGQEGSAFKPPHRSGGAASSSTLDSFETLAQQTRHNSLRNSQPLPDVCSNFFDQPKNNILSQGEKDMYYSQLRMASNHSHYNNLMQNYGHQTSSFTNFLNTPVESYADKVYPSYADKTPVAYSAGEALMDFLMSGSRECFGNE